MGFLDKLKGRGLPVDQLKARVAQFKSKNFAEASMAACALIAAADGRIDPAERQKTAAFIGSHDVLAAFDAAQLRESFDRYCGKLTTDHDFGRIEALQAVGKLRAKPDQARAVVQVGVLVGGADGDFDADERRAVRDLCTALGLDPVEFGV